MCCGSVFGVDFHEVKTIVQIADTDVVDIAGEGFDQLTFNIVNLDILNLILGDDIQHFGCRVRIDSCAGFVVVADASTDFEQLS